MTPRALAAIEARILAEREESLRERARSQERRCHCCCRVLAESVSGWLCGKCGKQMRNSQRNRAKRLA